MSSERLLTKDHDPTDSPDTESLLSTEQSQETLLHSLPSTTSKRNRRLKTYLHIAAIVFYSAITVLLYSWSTKINGQRCDYDNGAVYCKTTASYPWARLRCWQDMLAPARTAVEYEKQTIVHNVADHSTYRGPPQPEQDAAGEDLLRCTRKFLPLIPSKC